MGKLGNEAANKAAEQYMLMAQATAIAKNTDLDTIIEEKETEFEEQEARLRENNL